MLKPKKKLKVINLEGEEFSSFPRGSRFGSTCRVYENFGGSSVCGEHGSAIYSDIICRGYASYLYLQGGKDPPLR